MDDRSLLDRYLAAHDEGAFRELVGRHLDLVHAVARRVTANDELSRDAAQATFVKLARDAARVPRTVSLAAWLHRTSRCAAVDLVRSEDRRRKREQLAHQQATMNTSPEPEWERLAPVIDEAVDSLPAADRELVLAKYYGNESFAGIAARFGWTEANARKRASRSLEKLRHLLARRGLTTTAAALATALPAYAVSPAPASLAGSVFTAAAQTAPAPTLGIHLAMTTAQKSAAAAAVVALLASGWAGHALGSAHGREQLASSTGRPGSATLLVTTADRRPVADDPVAAFERLLSGEDRRTWTVVSRLDTTAMPQWLAKLRDLQKSVPRDSAEWTRLVEIESALYFHWADADPQAAWKDVAAIPEASDYSVNQHTETLATSVIAAWMRRSPDDAYTAAKHHPEHGYTARNMIILTWTPETLEENLAKHADKRRDLLGWFCASIVGDETKRETMIRYLLQEPAPKDADWGRMLLFRRWGYDDFHAAMARAEELELPDMVQLVFGDNLPDNPHKVMPWAMAKGMTPGGPQWEEGYRYWLTIDPAGARTWFETQAPAWERDGHDAAVAGFLAAELCHAMDPRYHKASAGNGNGSADAGAKVERLSGFLARWKAKDPAAESKWRNAASKQTRDRLAGTEAVR